jgi:hypothetical protein
MSLLSFLTGAATSAGDYFADERKKSEADQQSQLDMRKNMLGVLVKQAMSEGGNPALIGQAMRDYMESAQGLSSKPFASGTKNRMMGKRDLTNAQPDLLDQFVSGALKMFGPEPGEMSISMPQQGQKPLLDLQGDPQTQTVAPPPPLPQPTVNWGVEGRSPFGPQQNALLRNPAFTDREKQMDAASGKGLADIIAGNVDLQQLVQKSALTGIPLEQLAMPVSYLNQQARASAMDAKAGVVVGSDTRQHVVQMDGRGNLEAVVDGKRIPEGEWQKMGLTYRPYIPQDRLIGNDAGGMTAVDFQNRIVAYLAGISRTNTPAIGAQTALTADPDSLKTLKLIDDAFDKAVELGTWKTLMPKVDPTTGQPIDPTTLSGTGWRKHAPLLRDILASQFEPGLTYAEAQKRAASYSPRRDIVPPPPRTGVASQGPQNPKPAPGLVTDKDIEDEILKQVNAHNEKKENANRQLDNTAVLSMLKDPVTREEAKQDIIKSRGGAVTLIGTTPGGKK